tara:strand:- start:2659 stop:2961 length:303 start_codon:yes stop_codon:yes gene_type:complete
MRILGALLICILCGLYSWNARAQQIQCFPYDRFIERLQSIGEQMNDAGVDGMGNLVQLFTSEAGAWTFFVRIERNGTVFACPLAGGEGWEHHKPKRGTES